MLVPSSIGVANVGAGYPIEPVPMVQLSMQGLSALASTGHLLLLECRQTADTIESKKRKSKHVTGWQRGQVSAPVVTRMLAMHLILVRKSIGKGNRMPTECM